MPTHVLRRGDGQLNRQRPPRLQIVADILLQPPAYSQLVVANWSAIDVDLGHDQERHATRLATRHAGGKRKARDTWSLAARAQRS